MIRIFLIFIVYACFSAGVQGILDEFKIISASSPNNPGVDWCVSIASTDHITTQNTPPDNKKITTKPCGQSGYYQEFGFQLIMPQPAGQEGAGTMWFLAAPTKLLTYYDFSYILRPNPDPNDNLHAALNLPGDQMFSFEEISGSSPKQYVWRRGGFSVGSYISVDYTIPSAGDFYHNSVSPIPAESKFRLVGLASTIPVEPTIPVTTNRLKIAASPAGTDLCLELRNIVCGELSEAVLKACSTNSGYKRQEFKFIDKSTDCALGGLCYSIGIARKPEIALVYKSTGPALTSTEYSSQSTDIRSKYDFKVSQHTVNVGGTDTTFYKFKLVVTGTGPGTYYLTKLGSSTPAEGDRVGWTTTDPTAVQGSEDLKGLWSYITVS